MSDSPPLPDQQLIRRSDLNRLARPALGLPDSINLINRIGAVLHGRTAGLAGAAEGRVSCGGEAIVRCYQVKTRSLRGAARNRIIKRPCRRRWEVGSRVMCLSLTESVYAQPRPSASRNRARRQSSR